MKVLFLEVPQFMVILDELNPVQLRCLRALALHATSIHASAKMLEGVEHHTDGVTPADIAAFAQRLFSAVDDKLDQIEKE